ncbi:MAG: non-canonical purine NTP pyrophosphatase [Candidatus Levybacteria bacterium]|nr:non-canonical purine NTP pyrophosphatase [Candidatus Levybacteria bacterium]
MKNRLLIATRNPGKLGEFKEFLSDLSFEIVSLADLNIKEDVEENGKTYKENSQKKALFFAKLSGLPTIADDGGIEISALNNEPGVRSRRWLGYEATDEELINHMIKISKELPDNNRTAYFRTVVSLALPNGKVWSVKGEVKGIIAQKPHHKLLKGYPFRSFFFLPEINKYYHENDLTKEEQKLYNHRYKAVQKLKLIINKALNSKY